MLELDRGDHSEMLSKPGRKATAGAGIGHRAGQPMPFS